MHDGGGVASERATAQGTIFLSLMSLVLTFVAWAPVLARHKNVLEANDFSYDAQNPLKPIVASVHFCTPDTLIAQPARLAALPHHQNCTEAQKPCKYRTNRGWDGLQGLLS